MESKIHKHFLLNADFAYAYCRMIFDKDKMVYDFEFIEINPAFERIFESETEAIVGKTFRELNLSGAYGNEELIDQYTDIIKSGSDGRLEQYFPAIDSWFMTQVQVYEDNYFVLIYNDISKEKEKSLANKDISFINDLAFHIADYKPGTDIKGTILKNIKTHTGAVFAVYNEFNSSESYLQIKSVQADDALLSAILKIIGKKILKIKQNVPDSTYREIIRTNIKQSESLYELSFGNIAKATETAIKRISGVKQFIVTAHIVSGQLYGTTLLGFTEDHKLPSKDLCSSYGRLIAVLIRRQIAEKSLNESLTKLKKITDNISDVVFTADLNYKVKYITPSVEKVTGFTTKEMYELPIDVFFDSETVKRFKQKLKRELKHEKHNGVDKNRTILITAQFYRKDKVKIFLSMHLSFLRQPNGKIIGIQGVARDVTDETKTRQKLQTIIATIPDLLFHIDSAGRFVDFYQPTHRDKLYIQPEEFVGKTVYDIFDKSLADKMREATETTLDKGSYTFDYQLILDEGPMYFYAKYAKLNEDEVLAIISDITQLKKSELALRESEEKFRMLLTALGEGVGIVDLDENFIYTNPAAEEIFETGGHSLTGRSLYDFLTPQSAEKVNLESRKRQSGKSGVYELDILTEKKAKRTLLLTVTPHYEDASFKGAFGVFRDITQIKQTEYQLTEYTKELSRLNADKDRFMSILAHDLRSPFNSLLGFSGILVKNFRNYEDSEVERQLNFIHQISQNTYNLLDDLLLWSKSQANKLVFKPEKVNLHEMCDEIIEQVEYKAKSKNITIGYQEDEPVFPSADANMLRTILRNLISNALKFTNTGGEVKISARAEKKKCVVTVADNGIGMSAEKLSQLWSYSKASSATGTANEKGTGFGLMLCKEFTEKHGGKIWAESLKNSGSQFIFTLPLGS